MIGGVSIGAFMGALWCSEKNITTVTQKAREWSKVRTREKPRNRSLLIVFIAENDAVVAATF